MRVPFMSDVETKGELSAKELLKERMARLTPAQRAKLELRLQGGAPKASKESTDKEQPKSGVRGRQGLDYPVTPEQAHIWVVQQMDPTVYYFNHTHAFLLKGTFDIPAMERAINEVIRRHENLRTSFPEVEGKVKAVVAPQLHLPLEIIDVPEFPEEDRQARIQGLITAN